MVLGFNSGTLVWPFEIPFACDYLGFGTAGHRNNMQWHSSSTHIHIIHYRTETLRPAELCELLALTHPQSMFPAAQTRVRNVPAQALPITNTYRQKKRKNLQAYVSHSSSWTRRGSRGDTFPDGFSPTLTAYPPPPSKHLQLSSHTSGCLTQPRSPCLELFMAVPKLYLIQTASLNSTYVSLCKFPIPTFLSQLLLSCTLLLTTQ